jgi:hypothetical protein
MKESQYRIYSNYPWEVPPEPEILWRVSCPSTIQAQGGLTSVFEGEVVYPTWQFHCWFIYLFGMFGHELPENALI